MLCRSALPISRALPLMTSRLIMIRSAYPVAARSFHVSCIQNVESKANYATIAPEKPSTTTSIPQTPAKEDKTVAQVEDKPVVATEKEKRDFHWSHPVYTKEEYQAIQVNNLFCQLKLTNFDRLVTMKQVHSVSTSLSEPLKCFVLDSITSPDTNILQVHPFFKLTGKLIYL